MDKKIIIGIPLVILVIVVVLFQKDNIIKKTTDIRKEPSIGEVTFDCPSIEKNIGDSHNGGVVAHCNEKGDGGLVANFEDHPTNVAWGCNGLFVNNNSIDYGEGKDNTKNIIAACEERPIAASVCDNLTVDRYNDWFLPSQDELNHLYTNKNKIKNFSNAYYWSSTENNFISAMRQSFNLGVQNSSSKSGAYKVRCVRFF